jgi:hypothetical protein
MQFSILLQGAWIECPCVLDTVLAPPLEDSVGEDGRWVCDLYSGDPECAGGEVCTGGSVGSVGLARSQRRLRKRYHPTSGWLWAEESLREKVRELESVGYAWEWLVGGCQRMCYGHKQKLQEGKQEPRDKVRRLGWIFFCFLCGLYTQHIFSVMHSSI